MNNILRHEKIAELLVMFWECNLASADEKELRPDWTIPKMEVTVCHALSQAIRGMLDADYDEWLISGGTGTLSRGDFKEKVINYFIDYNSTAQIQVSHAINTVITNNN